MHNCKIINNLLFIFIFIIREQNPYENSSTNKKLNSMKYSQAISSEDLFGAKEDNSKIILKNIFYLYRV
jgi:hypothetical protein